MYVCMYVSSFDTTIGQVDTGVNLNTAVVDIDIFA